MTNFEIDKEFKSLIPPLTEKEVNGLESDIMRDGCRDPLVVWEGLLLDGHHRLNICQKHSLSYKVEVMGKDKIPNRMAAKIWIIDNQNHRRNLPPLVRAELALKKKDILAAIGKERMRHGLQNSGDPMRTDKEIAKSAGVSHDTVHKVKKILDSGDEALIEECRKGKEGRTSIHQAYKIVRNKEKAEKKAQERAARVAKAQKSLSPDEDFNIKHCDFREMGVEEESVALIFTDPPYSKECLSLYSEMAVQAARVLIPGGSLITFCGQHMMAEIIANMGDHLSFYWPLACIHTGRTRVLKAYGIEVLWKPMLWFIKGRRRRKMSGAIKDAVFSKQEKSDHEWQQSVIEASYYIERLTEKNELVYDPFCGSGTTCLAAKASKRNWIACDVVKDTVILARERIKDD